jgi:FAD:protein FMN transferase
MDYDEFRAMNSTILLAAEATPEQVACGFHTARAFIAEAEQRFSRFSEQSELSQLNSSQGKWFDASDDLFALVALAQDYFHKTAGLFDPSILPDLKRAGYDRSMDELHNQDLPPGTEKRGSPGFSTLCLDPHGQRIWLPDGMQIDLGGIAKGWIAEQAAWLMFDQIQSAPASLKRLENVPGLACAVNAGGDLFTIGLPAESGKWEIAVEDPRDPEKALAILEVGPGAVATSSVTKRRWQQAGKWQHHLIDPRSGEPAVSNWLSVTVVAEHAAEAEVFAKTLLIAGAEQSSQMLAGKTGLAYIAVDRQGQLWGSQNSQEYIHVNI